MKALTLQPGLRVGLCGQSKPLDYAAWLLRGLGVELVSLPAGAPADGLPVLLAGDPAQPDAQVVGSPLVVRLWDFHVGLPGSGIHASAVSGVSWVIGLPGRPPLYLPADIPEKWCGTLGAALVMSGFAEQATSAGATPAAREYDVTAAEILRSFADQNFGNHKQIPTSWRRNGSVSPEHGGIFPQGFLPCKDGYVGTIGRSRQDWALMLKALGDPEWATPELRDPFALARDDSRVMPLLYAELARHTRDELLAKALEYGATFAPVYTAEEARAAQIVRPEFFDANGAPGLPFEVVAETEPATAAAPIRPAGTTLAGPYYPLQGVRVLEFCWVWAGPFLGQFLADLGAEVIKIEWFDRYDVYRTRGIERLRGKVPEAVYREMSPSFHSLNRNKVGFAVNLKEAEGVELVRQLAARSDLVIENWSAGTLDRLGVGYEALKEVNPQLLMLSLSAFGPHSRLKDMRSYGLVTSALGTAETALSVDGQFVGTPTFNISDPNAALFGLLGALAGLVRARQTGQGMNLVVSQLEAVLAVMNEGVVRQPDDQVEGMYETADGAYVAVSLPADHGLGDLRAWCLAQPAAALIAAVQARGGAAAQACNVVDSAAGPTFADLEAHVASEHPVTGRENLVAAPWRVNQRRAPVRKPAPLMAEGNTYVLRDILGRSDADIAALRERQIA